MKIRRFVNLEATRALAFTASEADLIRRITRHERWIRKENGQHRTIMWDATTISDPDVLDTITTVQGFQIAALARLTGPRVFELVRRAKAAAV